MDWQLPDIGKTIKNNILPSSLSEDAVRIGRYSHSVDRQQSVISLHFRIVSFQWIRIGLYSRKNQIQQQEPHEARFKRLFQPNQPSMETTMPNYNYPEKHVPYQWQYKHCQIMRSRMKSCVLQAFRVTLQLKMGVSNSWFIGLCR